MAIKALIKNQTIMIDDHHWGSGEVKNWDDGSKEFILIKKLNIK